MSGIHLIDQKIRISKCVSVNHKGLPGGGGTWVGSSKQSLHISVHGNGMINSLQCEKDGVIGRQGYLPSKWPYTPKIDSATLIILGVMTLCKSNMIRTHAHQGTETSHKPREKRNIRLQPSVNLVWQRGLAAKCSPVKQKIWGSDNC